MTDKITILIVDDEKDICDQISGLLKDDGFLTFAANNSDDAIKYLKLEEINLVILDIWLNNSKLDGFKTLEKIKKLNELIPIIMISGHGNIETAVSAIKQGAYDFIEKPFDSDILLFKVNKALENIDLKREIKKLTNNNEQLFVRNSDITKNLYTTISKISKTESTILLSGASGSGKEIVAKEIHNLSNRKNKPFGILSCANLDPESLEKKLFGIEGKDNLIQIGILEKLNGGTILFDQIEDLPLKSQGKIIRFLEDQKIIRIGGNNSILINVRIIAITKVNLVKLIEEKKLTAGHAKILVGVENSLHIAYKILEKKLSVRQTENFVKIFKGKKISSIQHKDPNIKKLELEVSDKIGLNVLMQNVLVKICLWA